jgi:hypothetical protein
MKSPSLVEKTSGSLTVTAGATALAAVIGGPVAALLPVLTSTLANGRHQKRVELVLSDINDRLLKIERFEDNITDAQFKFISEVVISILNTPDDSKVSYLKDAVFNASLNVSLSMHHATVISRVLNSMSVSELAFLIQCHGNNLLFGKHTHDGFYNIDKFSHDGECALGLISLGLVARSSAEGDMSDIGAYHFTPLAGKVVELFTHKVT